MDMNKKENLEFTYKIAVKHKINQSMVILIFDWFSIRFKKSPIYDISYFMEWISRYESDITSYMDSDSLEIWNIMYNEYIGGN